MLDDVSNFAPYEPGWSMSMSGSGMVWRTEEHDGDVCVALTIPAVLHRGSISPGMAVSSEGSFRFVQRADDVHAYERFESLTEACVLVLKTPPVLVWDLVVRKRPPRRDDELSGEEGIYRRHVAGDRWVWRFVGDTVDVMLDVNGLEFRCVEIQRTPLQPSASP